MRSLVGKIALKYKWKVFRATQGVVFVEKSSKTSLIKKFAFRGEDAFSEATQLAEVLNLLDERIRRAESKNAYYTENKRGFTEVRS